MTQESRRRTALSAQPTFAVFAPFGTDAVLSTFPDGQTQDVAAHPLVRHLCTVAEQGVNVVALLDRKDDDTWLVQIPAHHPGQIVLESQGKLDMLSHRTLAEFVGRAHQQFPESSLVLAFEGHGAGYLPEVDLDEFARQRAIDDQRFEWREIEGVTRAFHRTGERAGQPVSHLGAPVLPAGSPTMPAGSPTMPTGHAALSTWAIGAGLREAGVPGISVIHFNNCFNMSVEVLHTVAPYADWATGYCNYNFFTSGQAYPGVFRRLADGDGATAEQLAKWFAEENHRVLSEAGHEPTVAGSVELARMSEIAGRVDELSDALLAALRAASPAQRPVVVAKIQQAIVASQQYDSNGDNTLAAPDELTDLDSFATELLKIDFGPGKVAATADSLRSALAGIKQYGDDGSPWMARGTEWNFSSKNLAMNIFLPDPLLNGVWDWRSQFYLEVNPDPSRPQRQRHVIDFLKETDWVDFLIEYHKDTPLVGLRPAKLPEMPVVHSKTDPRRRGTAA